MNHIQAYLKEVGRRLSPQSVAKYVDRLTRFEEWRKRTGQTEFNKANARAFLVWLQEQGHAASQVSLHRDNLSTFYGWLVENEVIEFNALPSLRKTFGYRSPKKGPECMFSEEEYRKLRTVATESRYFREHDWPGAIIFAWNTALRIGDICNITPADINLFAKKITLIPSKTKRFNKQVNIPILPDLEAFLQSQSLQGQYVLPAMQREYAKWGAITLVDQFSRICKAAGVEGKTFHGFRHTATSRMLNRNVPPVIVSSITGHTMEVLERYAHTTFEQAQAKVMEAMA